MDFKGFTGMSGRHSLERLLKSSKRPEGGGREKREEDGGGCWAVCGPFQGPRTIREESRTLSFLHRLQKLATGSSAWF